MPNFFDKYKCVIHYENVQSYFRLGLKVKYISCIRIQSISMPQTTCWIKFTKRIKTEKNSDKGEKPLYKLMNITV